MKTINEIVSESQSTDIVFNVNDEPLKKIYSKKNGLDRFETDIFTMRRRLNNKKVRIYAYLNNGSNPDAKIFHKLKTAKKIFDEARIAVENLFLKSDKDKSEEYIVEELDGKTYEKLIEDIKKDKRVVWS